MPVLSLIDLHYSHPDATPVLGGITLTLPPGTTGLVGANGAGKSTLLSVVSGALAPSSGQVHRPGRIGLVPQAADPALPLAALFGMAEEIALLRRADAGRAGLDELATADWTLETRLEQALAQVGLSGADPLRPLGCFSGGQRNRAALAAAFFDAPELVLLDEPTNNLDGTGRADVSELLASHAGVALVASHDRALLARMDRLLLLEDGRAELFGGGWEAFLEARYADGARALARLEQAERAVELARRTAAEATRKAAVRARRGKALRASGSQGKLLLDAARGRAEGSASGASRLAARQEATARRELEIAREAVPIIPPRRLETPVADRGRRLVLEMQEVGFAYPGAPSVLEGISLALYRNERVAVTGENGSGKSTLLRLAAGLAEPSRGQVLRPTRVGFLDQHAEILGHSGALVARFAALHPGLGPQEAHAALARMGFRGAAGLADVAQLSGGERVQAALALVLAAPDPPQLLILDEPTNHLDLVALEAIEAGLAAHAGALLVVSHDAVFLERIGITRQFPLSQAR